MNEVTISGKVFKKDFKVEKVGYNAQEVDAFLDEINQEIVSLESELSSLKTKIAELEAGKNAIVKKNSSLELEISNLKASGSVSQTSSANFSNIDLYNRIANLENMMQQLIEKIK